MDFRSCITLYANAPESGPRLPPAEYVEAVIAVPKEITGLERRYLEALQKNVRARREHDVLAQRLAESPSTSRAKVQETGLSEHVGLLRLKKRHEELQILQRYMTTLKNTAAARPDFLDLKKLQIPGLGSVASGYQDHSGDIGLTQDSVDTLVRRLEIAAIRAEHHLQRERRLLTEVEQDALAVPELVKQSNRSRALAATRDELVTWIDDRLSSSSSHEKSLTDYGLHEQQTELPIAHLQKEIMQKYDQYVNTRRRMLDLISSLTTALQNRPPEAQGSGTNTDAPGLANRSPTPSVLRFITSQIRCPTQLHQFHRQQTAYLTKLIDKERSKTTSELSRLADESHLLPTYPMLAQKERFKHVVATITPKPLVGNAKSSSEENEIIRRVGMWAFAADAAKEASKDIVRSHLEKGGEALEEGENWVVRLRDLLGDDEELEQENEPSGDRASDQDDGEDDEDVWALEAAGGLPARRERAVRGMKGSWAGLQGDVGVRKDT
jgi:hypothetical protein